jgi:hypothetical protein
MSKKKLYNQNRTIDFEINTVVSVDIDSLRLKLGSMSEKQICEKVEKAWSNALTALSGDEIDNYEEALEIAEAFKTSLVKAKLIAQSLRVESFESADFGEDEDD